MDTEILQICGPKYDTYPTPGRVTAVKTVISEFMCFPTLMPDMDHFKKNECEQSWLDQI